MIAQLHQYTIGFAVLGIGMLVQGTKRIDAFWLLGGILLLLVVVVLLFHQYRHRPASLTARSFWSDREKHYDEHHSTV